VVYLGHPVPGGYKYGDLALEVRRVSIIGTIKCGLESALEVRRVSIIGTIKYGLESHGTAQSSTSSNSKLQTRPLVRESATK
jgi:hypothetical protein